MSPKSKMRCSDCGVELNHHAEKLDLTAVLVEHDAVDSDLEGILEEFHTCPKCGRSESRRAS